MRPLLRLAALLPALAIFSAGWLPAHWHGGFHAWSGGTKYYAPNDQNVSWNGNTATMVVFAFGKHVRQGEVWLSRDDVDGKSVLQCPASGYLMAVTLMHALAEATRMSHEAAAAPPAPMLIGSRNMGEHVAEYYAEVMVDPAAHQMEPLVRIDFGYQDEDKRETYSFDAAAIRQIVHLLKVMCAHIDGHRGKLHAKKIAQMLKNYDRALAKKPSPAHPKKKKKQPKAAPTSKASSPETP
ncbi:MAG: hypothetical protein AAGK14_09630 [Verrucomicrobiota bacterium]